MAIGGSHWIQADYAEFQNSVVVQWIYWGDVKRDICNTGFKSAFAFKRAKDTKGLLRLESVGAFSFYFFLFFFF